MNLRLDHPHRAAQFFRRRDRLVNRETRDPARCRHAELAQNFLALIFVDLQRIPLCARFSPEKSNLRNHALNQVTP